MADLFLVTRSNRVGTFTCIVCAIRRISTNTFRLIIISQAPVHMKKQLSCIGKLGAHATAQHSIRKKL